jgi:SAM-dependent methyltransferase
MTDHAKLSKEIKKYWDERARSTDSDTKQATTYDVYLRELEIAKLKERLTAASLFDGATVVDLGCGDGHATVSIAEAFPKLKFLGIDWSEDMLAQARGRCEKMGLGGRVSFRQGDMRKLFEIVEGEKFEVFYTMRSLINLMQTDEQYLTLNQVADHLVPGGYYFGCENFMGGQNNFNRMREAMGLPEIPVRWHNKFFEEEEWVERLDKYFDGIELESFLSSYYLATRVIYSAGCFLEGKDPDYFHPIHQTAGNLPPIGDFCPIKSVSMRRKLG